MRLTRQAPVIAGSKRRVSTLLGREFGQQAMARRFAFGFLLQADGLHLIRVGAVLRDDLRLDAEAEVVERPLVGVRAECLASTAICKLPSAPFLNLEGATKFPAKHAKRGGG